MNFPYTPGLAMPNPGGAGYICADWEHPATTEWLMPWMRTLINQFNRITELFEKPGINAVMSNQQTIS